MTLDAKNLRPSRLRLLTCVSLWLVISGALLLAPGCYGRNCEGGAESFGTEISNGRMVTADVWESSGQLEKWLWFPRQHVYFFELPALGGRVPYETTAYLSAQEEPNKSGSYTQGGGNIALFSGVGPNRVDVRNDTCSDYYLRLVVKVPPFPPLIPDGGSVSLSPALDPDGGVADAFEEDSGQSAGR